MFILGHDITDILLKVALNTINLTHISPVMIPGVIRFIYQLRGLSNIRVIYLFLLIFGQYQDIFNMRVRLLIMSVKNV